MASPEEKMARLNALLERGVVMLHLDARRPGVRVPDWLKQEMQLRLNFNHRNGQDDLAVNAWGVRESLRFKGSWFPVSVPWSAVYAVSTEGVEAVVFPEDLPDEMVEAALARLQREGHSLETLEENRPKPLWPARERPRAPAPAVSSVSSTGPGEPGPEPSGPRRGHLRLVK